MTNAEKLAQLKKEMKQKKLEVDPMGFVGGGLGKIKGIKGMSKSVLNELGRFAKKKTGIKGLNKNMADKLTAFAKRPKHAAISVDDITSIQKARQYGSTCNAQEFEELKELTRAVIRKHKGNVQAFKKTGKNRYRNISEKARQQEILLKEALSEYKGSPDVLKVSDKSVAESWEKALLKDTR